MTQKLKLTNVFRKNAEAYLEKNSNGSQRYKFIINQGGSRSSKTFSILQLLVKIAHGSKKQIDIAGISVPHLKMGVLNDMPKVMTDYGLDFHKMFKVTDKSITFESGGVINFIALDKLGSAHGGARDVLYVNEANHHKYPIVEQLMMRTADCTFVDFNPTSRFWAHDIIDEKPESSLLIKSTYKDNQYLSRNIVEFIESKRGDGTNNFWRVYGLGEIGVAEGLIFNNWEVKDFDIHSFEKYRNGLDWGFSNDPFAFVRVAIERNNLYICEEIYQTGLLNKDSAPMVQRIVRGEPVMCDSSEPKSIVEYNQMGIKAYAVKKGAGSIETGIKKIQSFDNVFIHPSCIHAKDEFANYKWKEDKNGEAMATPESGFDHLIDAIRYSIENDSFATPDPIEEKINPTRRRRGGGGWMAA